MSGVVAATACGFFGGLVMMFQASVVGGGAETLLGPVRAGALAGHGFALFAMGIGWGLYAADPEEEGRRRYCLGGAAASVLWMLAWAAFGRAVYEWLEGLRPLVGS